jgi:AP endonuclease-1
VYELRRVSTEANVSPGSTVGACTKEESFATIAKAINQVHTEVPEVVCVIENMVSDQTHRLL